MGRSKENPIKNIQLAFPCDQKLAGIEQNGNFCAACSKQLFDFRNATANELETVKKQANQPVCGIFKREQLAGSALKYAVAGSVVVLSSLALPVMGQTSRPDLNGTDEAEINLSAISVDSLEMMQEEETEVSLGIMINIEEPATVRSIKGKEFKEGASLDNLMEVLKEEVKFPQGLDVEGRVFLSLTIDIKGKLTDVQLLRGFHPLAEEEAIRAVWALEPVFYPATQSGIPVPSKFVIPVTFKK